MMTVVGENEIYKNFKWLRETRNFLRRRLKRLLYKQDIRHSRKALKGRDETSRWKTTSSLMRSESLFDSADHMWN